VRRIAPPRALGPEVVELHAFLLHTGLLDAINNKFRVIKPRARGFHDGARFFLKIRATFPARAHEISDEPGLFVAAV
jgi:hypothetical protein